MKSRASNIAVAALSILMLASSAHANGVDVTQLKNSPISEWITIHFWGVIDSPSPIYSQPTFTGSLMYDPAGAVVNYNPIPALNLSWFRGTIGPYTTDPFVFASMNIQSAGFVFSGEAAHYGLYANVNFAGTGEIRIFDESGFLAPVHGIITGVPEMSSLGLLAIGLAGIVGFQFRRIQRGL